MKTRSTFVPAVTSRRLWAVRMLIAFSVGSGLGAAAIAAAGLMTVIR